jgi:hypothetical protein
MTRTFRSLRTQDPRSRRYSVTRRRACAIAAVALSLLTGCAPDAFRRDPAFEAWIGEVRKACYRERIGTDTVGNLLGNTGSREGNHFLNQTSRLYAGRLTREQWTSGVLAFLSGRPSDPGIQCVLEQLPKR